MPHLSLENAQKPLALAIDIGTSSVRAVVFDATGAQIDGFVHKERYRPTLTPDGGSTVDAERMRARVSKCVRKVCEKLGEGVAQIDVVGVSCFWHSLLGLDASGTPTTPVYMWNDKRSSEDAFTLAVEMDSTAVHQRTGCRLHSSYWPAKLRWLQRTHADQFERVATWCSLTDWLLMPDAGELSTSVCMASGTGLLNTSALAWDEEMLAAVSIRSEQLPTIIERTAGYRPAIDLPAGLEAEWYPAIGDGAAANIGAGAIGEDRIALTIGTSGAIRLARAREEAVLPPSLWRYLIDADTEVIGGALSNGGNMLAWFSGMASAEDRDALTQRAAAIAPTSHGLDVLPFLAGERAPSWQDSLAGTITGLTLDTSAAQIYRALMESAGLRFAAVYEDARQFAQPDHTIVANGGALLQSPLWSQIVADALGHPLSALQSRAEASARGAAVVAINAAGHLPSLRTDPEIQRVFTPEPTATAAYAAARERLESLERALNEWKQETP